MAENNEPGRSAGGLARAKSLSKEDRSEIARKAAAARWNSDLPTATHAGTLEIGGAELPCYVLENGERIFSTRGIMKSLGRTWRGRKYSGTELPVFLEAKNIKPFIDSDLRAVLEPIDFITDRGLRSEGFKAEVLPATCEVYLQARSENVLTPAQFAVAQRCEMLVRGFSRVGIIALVDEATGYQHVRARKALEEILEQFLSDEKRKWAKTFPDEFYQEMFRLKGWSYLSWSVSRPGVVGKYTNDIVYERLAPGVLEELKKKNPPNRKGNRPQKHFQWLTEDVGHPKLREHLASVVALMKASDDWKQFKKILNRALPRYGDTLELKM